MRVLIGGVGYTNLHDLSVGPAIIERLKKLGLPEYVELDEFDHLIATYQKLSETRYDKLILVGAVKRGRKPGTIHTYSALDLPDEEEIRLRVAEGVAGTVSLESILILCRYYDVLPSDLTVIEIEPEDDNWGEGFTPKVEQAVEKVIDIVLDEARIAPSGDMKANV